MMRFSSEKGFTLVELAIALVVIGLLIGGVLKSQELIEHARATAAIRQINAYDAATSIFKSTYSALPGDIENPGARIPDCTSDLCNIGGNGNEVIRVNGVSSSLQETIEQFNFFGHLTKARLIASPKGGTTAQMSVTPPEWWMSNTNFFPVLLDSSVIVYNRGTTPIEGHEYFIMRIPAKMAEFIDFKIDDGKMLTGAFMGDNLSEADCIHNTYEQRLDGKFLCRVRIKAAF